MEKEKEMNQRLKVIEGFKSSHEYTLLNEKEREKKIKMILCTTKTTTEDKRTKNDEYYSDNEEAIKKARNQKVVCSLCGETTSKGNYTKHKMTILCKKLYEKNKEIEELNKYNTILLTKLNRKTRKPLK